jgi:hypothetical protein
MLQCKLISDHHTNPLETLLSLIDVNCNRLSELEDPLELWPNAPITQRVAKGLSLTPVSGVSLFILTLFIPIERTTNVAYTLPLNHRLVDQAHLRDATENGVSIQEGIYADATGKFLCTRLSPQSGTTRHRSLTQSSIKGEIQNQSFQASDLEVAFFQVVRASRTDSGLPFSSLSRIDVVLQDHMRQGVVCEVVGLEAYRFDTTGMKALAHVLWSQGKVGHQQDDLYDWTKILAHPEIRGLGATIEALNALAQKLNAPFSFKATASVPECNRFFHQWFQSTHNVRLGVVEGGHRCETAMRVFYGYGIGQTAPLRHKNDFRPINATSTLVQPCGLKVMHPHDSTIMYTEQVVKDIRDYSGQVQKQRTLVVKPTYKQLWKTIYTECLNLLDETEFERYKTWDIDAFIEEKFEKSADADKMCVFIERIKKIVCDLYFAYEPGKSEMAHIQRTDFDGIINRQKTSGRNFIAIRIVSYTRCDYNQQSNTLTSPVII